MAIIINKLPQSTENSELIIASCLSFSRLHKVHRWGNYHMFLVEEYACGILKQDPFVRFQQAPGPKTLCIPHHWSNVWSVSAHCFKSHMLRSTSQIEFRDQKRRTVNENGASQLEGRKYTARTPGQRVNLEELEDWRHSESACSPRVGVGFIQALWFPPAVQTHRFG